MLDRVLEYFASLAPEDAARHTLEAIALCEAGRRSYIEAPEDVRPPEKTLEAVPAAVAHWMDAARAGQLSPAEQIQRHQPLVHELTTLLEQDRYQELGGDEMAFLRVLLEFTGQLPASERLKSLRNTLMSHAMRIDAGNQAETASPGLPDLGKRLRVLTPAQLEEASPREIRKFAGIEMTSIGPLTRASMPVKVLGSVPANCMLVVEQGSCHVEGYVLGKVAATLNCYAQENISGTVVVRRGDVRARNLIDRSFVVAKRGNVICRKALNPGLIFAGTRIHISEEAIMGAYTAPQIEVLGDATGGIYNVSKILQARHFRHEETRPMHLVLRRDLSCEDYGEVPERAATILLGKAARLQQHIRNLLELTQYVARETEEGARTALLYLTGGKPTLQRVRELDSAQQRLAALNRVILGLHQLSQDAEDAFARKRNAAEAEAEAEAEAASTRHSPSESLVELDDLEASDELTTEIRQELDHIQDSRVRLYSQSDDRLVDSANISDWRDKLHHWIKERQRLTGEIERTEREIEMAIGKPDEADESSGQAAVERLRYMLGPSYPGRNQPEFLERARSQFIKIMLRSLNKRVAQLKRYRDQMEQTREELDTVCQRLRSEFQMEEDVQRLISRDMAMIQGRFDAGVRLYTGPYLIGEEDPPEGSVLEISEPPDGILTYRRGDFGIVEVS